MKDESTMLKESVWVDDKTITECQQCQKPFSVARRKVRKHLKDGEGGGGWGEGERREGGREGRRREDEEEVDMSCMAKLLQD